MSQSSQSDLHSTTKKEHQKSSEEERSNSATSVTSKGSNPSSGSGLVKWLYPGANNETNMETSSLNTEQSIPGSSLDPSSPAGNPGEEEMEAKTSPSSSMASGSIGAGVGGDQGTTTGGPDMSDAGSVEELPIDVEKNAAEGMTEDISQKMTASANYLGSIFTTAWNKTAKTANDATVNSSSFFSSALNKVVAGSTNTSKSTPKEGENDKKVTTDNGNENVEDSKSTKKDETIADGEESNKPNIMSASSLFNSAISSFGFSNTDNSDAKKEANSPNSEQGKDLSAQFGITGFSNAWTTLSKVAGDATNTIKEKVATKNIISEFNTEQENFIKSKGNAHDEVGVAPWVGYQGEEELKSKIMSLSQDRRNFVRAPPSGVSFEFDYSSVSSTALALLQEDVDLKKMRYDLVPKVVKEDEFWRNYFYRVNLIKQSFELKDLERENEGSGEKSTKAPPKTTNQKQIGDIPDDVELSQDQDDEFVSDSYQASTSDMADVDESMKKLGVMDKTEEWEAELEGELNEFEVVNSKEDNPEWESQIQEMLDAEEEENVK